MRSIVMTVLVLAVAVLAVTGFLRACSFAPTTPDVDRSTLPRVDVAEVVTDATASVSFPLRAPAAPADWVPQSFDVVPVAGTRAVRLGWVTPDSSFVRLVQSNAPEDALVRFAGGQPAAQGTVADAGRPWVVHTGVRDESLWVADLGDVRLLITGSGSPSRFTQLAEATLAAPIAGR